MQSPADSLASLDPCAPGTDGTPATVREISLDFRRLQAELARGYDGPFLLLDLDIVRAKARRFMAAMPRVRPAMRSRRIPIPA